MRPAATSPASNARSRSVSGALIILAATLVFVGSAASATRSDLDAVASDLSGQDVRIACSKTAGHLGLVWFRLDPITRELVPDRYATLRWSVCQTLLKVPRRVSWRTPKAILVLAHESAHLRGVVDEQAAECEGLQNVVRVAKLLGLSDADANWVGARARERTFCRTLP